MLKDWPSQLSTKIASADPDRFNTDDRMAAGGESDTCDRIRNAKPEFAAKTATSRLVHVSEKCTGGTRTRKRMISTARKPNDVSNEKPSSQGLQACVSSPPRKACSTWGHNPARANP